MRLLMSAQSNTARVWARLLHAGALHGAVKICQFRDGGATVLLQRSREIVHGCLVIHRHDPARTLDVHNARSTQQDGRNPDCEKRGTYCHHSPLLPMHLLAMQKICPHDWGAYPAHIVCQPEQP